MKIEEWKFIPGYEGLYIVSNLGCVKSMWFGKERILKQSNSGRGYLQVKLCKNGKQKPFTVHILVWMAFGSSQRNGRILQVDHINNDKTDNRIENLQLLSNRANCSKGKLQKENKSSKFTGVSWYKQTNKWRASIRINNKHYHLGHFDSEEKAKEIYQYALTHHEEIINRPYKKTSKYKGVCWNKNKSKWVAYIYINKKQIYIGSFNTELEASEAYLKAKENLL